MRIMKVAQINSAVDGEQLQMMMMFAYGSRKNKIFKFGKLYVEVILMCYKI